MSMSVDKTSLSFITAKDTQLSECQRENKKPSKRDEVSPFITLIRVNDVSTVATQQLQNNINWTFESEYPYRPLGKEVIPRQKVKKRSPNGTDCSLCKAELSPEWRQGPLGKSTLCNACGLAYSKYLKGTTNYWEQRVRLNMSDAFSIRVMLQKNPTRQKSRPSQDLDFLL